MNIPNELIIEKTNLTSHTNFGDKFNIPSNYVIYFEKEANHELTIYVRKNYLELKHKFSSIGLNFIYTPELSNSIKNIDKLIEYYLPQLNWFSISNQLSENYRDKILEQIMCNANDAIAEIFDPNYLTSTTNNHDLLSLVNYNGELSCGFLFFEPYAGAIGASDSFINNSNRDYSMFFNTILTFLKPEEFDYSLAPLYPFLETDQIDNETKTLINDFESKLNELKDSGQLLLVIPILKELISMHTEKIDFTSISKIEIKQNNIILLPYFKKEVELSHLTKSIYFLFLKHPEGINLKELKTYRKELLTIYTSVSNQLDYDKMAKSIDDVINLETKAIYTHLSRIKSAYYKIMDESIARNYIIDGSGENDRKINLSPSAVIWENLDNLDGYES